MKDSSRSRGDLVASLLLTLAAAAVAHLVLVELSRYVAVFFCSVLAALALDVAVRRLTFGGRLPRAASLALTVLALGLLAAGLAAWVGPQLVEQFEALREQVPRGLDAARRWFMSSDLGQRAREGLPDLGGGVPGAQSLAESAGRFLSTGATAAGDFLVFVFIALFVAADPQRYSRGALRLLPRQHRERAGTVLEAAGDALRRWLLARGALMLLVAVLFGGGLLLLGLPLALPLALLAGLFSFVPYVGPALAVIPALAIGLLESPTHALYVAALYLGVQLVESYLIEPLVEGRAISLPPALIIISQVLHAMWLGPIGVLVATPLLVVIVVAVQILYQRGVLGDETEVAGS